MNNKQNLASVSTSASTRVRGVGFPRLSLGSAIQVMEKACKYGRQWSKLTFSAYSSREGAKGSMNSGAFINRLAALKDYGLITNSGDVIAKTELTDKIVHPTTLEERLQAIRTAFFNVESFKQITDTVEHGVSLDRSSIKSLAVDMGISRIAMNQFVSSFVESGKTAGLINENDNGKLQIISDLPIIAEPLQKASDEKFTDSPNIFSFSPVFSRNEESSTTFNTQQSGAGWSILVKVGLSKSVEPETRKKINTLIESAEEIAAILRSKEKEG